jgi:hypothetical protein
VPARNLGPAARRLSGRKRIDAVATFGFTLVLPLLVVGTPLPVLDLLARLQGTTPVTSFVPHSQVIWTVLGAFPAVGAWAVFAQDRRDGRTHHPGEYLASVVLGGFLFAQCLVWVTAFLDEFVFRKPSVYVTTTRARDDGSNGRPMADD